MAEATDALEGERPIAAATGEKLPTAQVSKPRPIEEVHIDELLRLVVEKRGSDLHLAAGVPPVMRIDGQLYATNSLRDS